MLCEFIELKNHPIFPASTLENVEYAHFPPDSRLPWMEACACNGAFVHTDNKQQALLFTCLFSVQAKTYEIYSILCISYI